MENHAGFIERRTSKGEPKNKGIRAKEKRRTLGSKGSSVIAAHKGLKRKTIYSVSQIANLCTAIKTGKS